jgi:hypothetical protein
MAQWIHFDKPDLFSFRPLLFHCHAGVAKFSLEVEEIKIHPDDERGLPVVSREPVVSGTLDGGEYAKAGVESILEKMARRPAGRR